MSRSYRTDSWQGITLLIIRDLVFACAVGLCVYFVLRVIGYP